ncbi:HIT domain-containing protein [Priestia taiwanensis]|uniref:Hydrolase n=1 Tax=Priestia taiwanensis TaxID=1347902 RepID=A0A917AR81_9BACI|nr:HIT domain-containing protein [Priestia taiwanensis]MBM7363192.1 histidine triad (HIT) family protein [Priestia taiwanensis]GGE68395.1 hydrolase [Priestia taiwanensis]
MGNDFYCEEVFSGKTKVDIVKETEHVLAYYHTRPFYEVHIVVVPKKHILSFTNIEEEDMPIVYEVMSVIREVATEMEKTYGACRIITNLGEYQDSKHMHFHVVFGAKK